MNAVKCVASYQSTSTCSVSEGWHLSVPSVHRQQWQLFQNFLEGLTVYCLW